MGWPALGPRLLGYYSIDEAKAYLRHMRKLKERKVPMKKVAALYRTPDVIRRTFQRNAIIGLKVAKDFGQGTTTEDRVELSNFLFDVLGAQLHGNIFCENSLSLVLSPQEVKKLCEKAEWTKAGEEERNAIGRLVVSADSLLWSLYFDFFIEEGETIHGAYDVSERFGEGATLLVQDYFCLKPVDLWEECRAYSIDSLRIYAVYKGIHIGPDFLSHVFSDKPAKGHLIAFNVTRVERGRESVLRTPAELLSTASTLANDSVKQFAVVNSLPMTGILKKGAELSWHAFKGVSEFLGEDWRPPKEVFEFIERDKLKLYNSFKGTKRTPEQWRILFDPRDDRFRVE